MPNLRPDRAARALIEQLRGRNFMLCSVGGRSYAFVHRTFLEYFCAVEIRERFQTEQSLTLKQLKADVFGHWQDETWHEVLCLLAGMLAPRFVGEILEWLIAQDDKEKTCYHVLLAARCVGEVRKRLELGDVVETIQNRTMKLTRFNRNDYDLLWADEARSIVQIGARAVMMVATVWRDLYATRAWLKTGAQSDENWDVRQSALQELARGWKDDPETLPITKNPRAVR